MPHDVDQFDFKVFPKLYGPLDLTFEPSGEHEIVYKIPWADSIPFQAALKGLPRPPTYVGQQRPPHPHPELPPMVCLRTRRIPFGKSIAPANGSKFPTWPWAKVHAYYGLPPFVASLDQPPDPVNNPFIFAEEHFDYAAEFFATGPQQYVWKYDLDQNINPPGMVNQLVAVQLPVTERTIVLHRLASINRRALQKYVGSVNKTAWSQADPGCLLFMGASTARARGTEAQGIECTLKFRERWYPWNFYYRPDSKTLDQFGDTIYWQPIEPKPYMEAEFTEVFNTDRIRFII